ncbi:MAG: hypothetical protein R6X02_16920 [Enhygromyxa sp.]
MSNDDVLGIWYCELVDQEQSDEEAEEFGDYDDYDRPPQKAAKTEFATTTLELRDDGSYRLEGPDWGCSHGSWTREGGGIELSEAEDSSNGFDGLEYAHHSGDRLVVGFKLVPDAHDGLDILVLTFGRTPPAVKGPKPEGFVDRLIAVEDQDEIWELLDALEGEPAEVERALWDAWIDGRFLSDPESEQYDLHAQILESEQLTNPGGFTHAHARHALTTIDYDEHRAVFDLIFDRLALLPEDDQADAELMPLITGPWFERMVSYRYLGGGVPEEFYHRALVPQPAMDDACRDYVLRSSYYTRFESIERLFPPGDPDFVKAALRYRGRGMLDLVLAQIDERGVAEEALAAALEQLGDPAAERSMELWLSGILFAAVLSIRAGQPLPALVLEQLAKERRGTVIGGPSGDDKPKLRELIAGLPKDQRELISARFWLDKN